MRLQTLLLIASFAYSVYGSCSIPAVVVNGSALGFQFHPERSGMSGLHLLASSVLQLLSK